MPQLGYSLTLTQTQKLIMTPELRQAITILQLSALELDQYIEKELLENPLLDRDEEVLEEPEASDEEHDDEIDWDEYFQSSGFDSSNFSKEKKEKPDYDNFISQAPSLQEHLMFQLHLSSDSKKTFKIGEFLIGNIDKRGYLTIDISEIARFLKVEDIEVEKTLKLIQTFDPPGIAARSLEECLLIQLENRGIKDQRLTALINNHLKDIADARYNRIADSLGITLSEVQNLKDIISTLDPKPARNFSSTLDTQYIIPDATIKKVDNEYIVIMNESSLPKLSINSYYRSLLLSEDKESNISKFLSNRFDSALWLIKSIEQRRITLNRVISSIVKVQRDFLDYGLTHLKPLTLKEIADMINVHESTVSRAINGKYVQTPRGVFPLKFFFQTGLDNVNGTSISTECIKKTIEDIISAENPRKPLSDQKIADKLKQKGIIISRRTVAKYRDEIGIPSSTRRKRY